MTEAQSILGELHERGVRLRLLDGSLRYRPVAAVPPDLRERLAKCKEGLLALVERLAERAAIREFDGGLPREEAERLALEDVLGEARAAS